MENRVVLVGRLGKEPDVKDAKGHKILRISVATDDSYKSKETGEWVNNTDWHNLTLWNKQAEYVAKFGFKGAIVMVIGMLKTRKYTDQNGNERFDYHVQPTSIKVLNPKKVEGGGATPPPSGGPPPGDDDLPF